jgi:hypothetical protein
VSFNRTYGYTLAIAVDQFAAALIFNRPDLTISTLCWIVLASSSPGIASVPYDERAVQALAFLKLSIWQHWLLRQIGRNFLERLWPGHCVAARASDLARAKSASAALG